MDKPKVIVICGPTASGKTSLSISLAKKINGEIVSCDSMQIYKEMDIGSAKPTVEEMQEIKHYLVDFVSPEKRYSVSEYKEDASKAIEEIINKGKPLGEYSIDEETGFCYVDITSISKIKHKKPRTVYNISVEDAEEQNATVSN